MKFNFALVTCALMISGCSADQQSDESVGQVEAVQAEGPAERFPAPEPDSIDDTSRNDGMEDGRRYWRGASYPNMQAGTTHELGAECYEGDVAVDADYEIDAGTRDLVVNGPYPEGNKKMFYQTYRTPAGGSYYFKAWVRCRRR